MRSLLQQFAVLLVGLMSACSSSSPGRLYNVAIAPHQSCAHVLQVTGIGGATPEDRAMLAALRSSGFAGSLQLYDWTGGEPSFAAYCDRKRQMSETRRVVEMVTAIRRSEPQGQIILIGDSAGAGIAVWTLERLPADVRVDQVVLLAPALSPTYDLRPALAHVDHKMIVFPSDRDTLVLGVATTLFGTIDVVHTNAAGLSGFDIPPGAQASYQKVTQRPYDPAWLELGDDGGHSGAMAPSFVSVVLSPMLTHPNNDRPLFASAGGPIRVTR
jgi:pimeloyl-ACP methyl ester carboxylesterase